MFRKSINLLFFVVMASLGSLQAYAETLILKPNTFIPVILSQNVSSEDVTLGQDIFFTVAGDVKVQDRVVISAGTTVLANITDVEKRGAIGSAGKIVLSFISTKAVNGADVPLRGVRVFEGDDELVGTVVVGVVLCPLALLNQGEAARVGEGLQARAIVASEIKIDI